MSPPAPISSTYLRDRAQKCTRLARDCPHAPTSHELEALGIDLMEKAAEVDELFSDLSAQKHFKSPGNN